MSGEQNRLSRFWQELKRRRVIHVITVYASASFAIIEIINNLTEPLNLPASLSAIVLIVLAAGFPLAIILSWLYDLTSGSFERTRSLEETEEEVKPVAVPNAWKIATYVSFVVIVGLVVFNIITRGDVIKPGSIQSMIVLPFQNYTGDDQLEYFVSGMHSSLISDIGKVSGLRVLSETTSNIYKSAEKSVPQIVSELGVDAVIEAQVLCLGDTICLQIRVVTADPEEKQLWIGDYREDKSKILSLYNRVTRQIANEVKVGLTPEEQSILSKSRIIDREAYDDFLKARQYWGDFGKESLQKALEYLNNAIEKEPAWAPLYSGLAKVYIGRLQMGFDAPDIAIPNILSNLNKAVELDPDFADSHFLKGLIAIQIDWDWDKSEKEFLNALVLNPNDAFTRSYYANLLMILGRSNEAVVQGQLAVDLDPLNPLVLAMYSVVLNDARNFKTAADYAEKALSIDSTHFFANAALDYVSFFTGDSARAIEAMTGWLPYLDEKMLYDIKQTFRDKGYNAAIKKTLSEMERADTAGFVLSSDLAFYSIRVNETSKALDWFEKGYEIHDPGMPYLGTFFFSFNIKNEPRYIALMNKMNLPLPESD